MAFNYTPQEVAYLSNEEIANTCHFILQRHKLPLHYQNLAILAALELNKETTKSFESKVLRALNTHPHYFHRVRPGVYQSK